MSGWMNINFAFFPFYALPYQTMLRNEFTIAKNGNHSKQHNKIGEKEKSK